MMISNTTDKACIHNIAKQEEEDDDDSSLGALKDLLHVEFNHTPFLSLLYF